MLAVRTAFALVGVGLITCAIATLVVPGSLSEADERLIDVLVYMGAGAVALAACLFRVFKVRVERVVWIAIAVAVGAWLIGTATVSLPLSHGESGHQHATEILSKDVSVPHEEPAASEQPVVQEGTAERPAAPEAYPAPRVESGGKPEAPVMNGWRDLFYMIFLVAGAVGLGTLMHARIKPFQATILLDGAIVALAATAVVSTVGGAMGAGALQMLLPLTSIGLLSFLVWTVTVLGRKGARVWLWPVGAFAFAAVASVADVARVVSGGGDLPVIEALWPAAMLLVTVAAWQEPQAPIRPNLEGRGKTLAVSAAASIALVLMGVDYAFGLGALTLVLTAASLSLLIARASVAFRENRADGRWLSTPGADRLPDRARQPPQADDRPAARDRGGDRLVAVRAAAARPRRLQVLQRHLRTSRRRRAAAATGGEPRSRDRALRLRLQARRRRVLRARHRPRLRP